MSLTMIEFPILYIWCMAAIIWILAFAVGLLYGDNLHLKKHMSANEAQK